MEFLPLTRAEIPLLRSLFARMGAFTCDYTVGGMFMWRDHYKMQYAREGEWIFTRLLGEDGLYYYNLPLGGDLKRGLAHLAAWARERGDTRLRFCTIPEAFVEQVRETVIDPIVTEQTDLADYLYDAGELRLLSGKKYAAQRNHIHRFENTAGNWWFIDLDKNNIGAVNRFFIRNFLRNETLSPAAMEENRMVADVLEHYDEYGMVGGVLYVDNETVGFSLGERVGEVLFVHVEKADRNFGGAYQTLSNGFARRYGIGARYINREEDMGNEGLRRAKMAYHPVKLLKKYTVEGMI